MKIVKILNLDFGAHVVFLLSQNWMALNFHCFLIMSRGLSKIIYVKLSFLDTCNLGLKSPLFYFELPHEGPLFPNFDEPSKEGKPDWDGCIRLKQNNTKYSNLSTEYSMQVRNIQEITRKIFL